MDAADYSIFVTWCETLGCYIATAPEFGGIFIADGQTRTEAIEAGEKAVNHWRDSAAKAGEEMPRPLSHLDLLEILERIAFPDQNEEQEIFASGWDACFQQFAGYLISHGLNDATIGFEEALGKHQEQRAERIKKLMIGRRSAMISDPRLLSRETERKNNVIHINFLSETDRGRWVIYRRTGSLHSERGRIKDWTDQLIYVVYQCADQWDRFEEYTAAATDPEDLEFA